MDIPAPLDERQGQILKAVVTNYTQTAIPVGSHALVSDFHSLSPATIRNELAALGSIGYLFQPHTSAGRVPSDLGYRYYVDFLMEEELIPTTVRRQIDPYMADMPVDIEDVLEVAAMVLAVVTDAVSVATGPSSLSARIKHLDVALLDDGAALIVLVLDGNVIRQQAVTLSRLAGQDELSALARRLSPDLRGLDIDAINRLPTEEGLGGEIVAHVSRLVHELEAGAATVVVHDGVRNLLRQPEFGDVERLREVFDVIDEERVLGEILGSLEVGAGVQMMIGRENGVEQLRRCSLVLTSYRAGPTRHGTIGVLGPTRMRYAQVAPRVRYVSRRVGAALERLWR